MPSRAVTSFLRLIERVVYEILCMCQCPHGLLPHFYDDDSMEDWKRILHSVNALTGCYLISTSTDVIEGNQVINRCQCPHGLLPHFYLPYQNACLRHAHKTCQCPHGLLPHFYMEISLIFNSRWLIRVNALTGCYLISTCMWKRTRLLRRKVSMPSRAVTSFLHDYKPTNVKLYACVSMPSRAVTSFLPGAGTGAWGRWVRVSMPSRAVTSFLQRDRSE